MGLRFKKSVKIAKGVKVNFGKTGASLTVGTRGLHHTIHTSGKKTSSIGLPGTGLSYVSTSGGGKGKRSQNRSRQNTRSSVSAAQIQREQEVQYAKNCEMVDDYNELIDQIRSIHDECSAPVDWEGLRDAPEPFGFMGVGPNESEAVRAGSSPALTKSASKNWQMPSAKRVRKTSSYTSNGMKQGRSRSMSSMEILTVTST